MTNKIGKCHLCGEREKLSFEHVPPRGAFNKSTIKIYGGNEIIGRDGHKFPWDFSDLRGKQSQRGFGQYTLCEACNSFTGAKYGAAYIEFIYQGWNILVNNLGRKNISANFTNIYPLRVLKQLISMFFSINSPNFTISNSNLSKFVLSPSNKGLNNRDYALYIYFLAGNISKYIGLSGVLKIGGRNRYISEMANMPFGFVLEIDPVKGIKEKYNLCDILGFANCYNYDECTDIKLNIPFLDSNTIYPIDYRTREEIFNQRIENRVKELLKN